MWAMMGTGRASGEKRAREAVSWPSQSIAGGHQPVRCTWNPGQYHGRPRSGDREFDEVGKHGQRIRRDDATVVVGTVIDPEMVDEMRVTVVCNRARRRAAGSGEAAGSRNRPVAGQQRRDRNRQSRLQRSKCQPISGAIPNGQRLVKGRRQHEHGVPGYSCVPASLRRTRRRLHGSRKWEALTFCLIATSLALTIRHSLSMYRGSLSHCVVETAM